MPYAALAALYRGQLHATALMWRSMRGKQRLPLLRLKLHGMLRGAGSSSIPGGLASHGSHQHRTAGPDAGITGLKQLSGSMLLFMPLLLLLPTTAWFYVAALALHTACSLLRAAVHFTLQLLTGPTCDSSSGSCEQQWPAGYSYQLLAPRFEPATLSDAARQAIRCTTYLQAQQLRSGRSWKVLGLAAAQAWSSCCFVSLPQVCSAALCGQPLWLAYPLACRLFWHGNM